MSKFKGTPGPWELVNGFDVFSQLGADSGDGYKAPADDGWFIASVEIGTVTDESGELVEMGRDCVAANARLIAASPKLLEAAIMAIEHYDEFFKGSEPPEDLPWVPVMREAIKEALGEDAT